MRKLRGVLCPVATPFDHAGDLYPTKLRHNLGRLGRTRVAGYVLCAWDGEGTLLSGDERRRVWELAAEAADGRPRIAATSAESVHEAVALAKAAKVSGCEGLWLRAPADYRGPDEEPRAALFFRSVADRVELPVAVVVDRRRPVSAKTAAEVAGHPNVAAVCYRGGDSAWLKAFQEAGGDPAVLWIGSERLWKEAWEMGSRTAALALANAIPFHLLSVEEALRTRETDAAEDLIRRVTEAADIPGLYGPAGLKAAMDLRGCYGGAPRLPLIPVDGEARADIERRMAGLAS
jgi:4-hydroxy-2-oxoglutarate aldolase